MWNFVPNSEKVLLMEAVAVGLVNLAEGDRSAGSTIARLPLVAPLGAGHGNNGEGVLIPS